MSCLLARPTNQVMNPFMDSMSDLPITREVGAEIAAPVTNVTALGDSNHDLRR